MWSLAPPAEPIESVLGTCISNISDAVRKSRFAATAPALAAAAANYVVAAESNALSHFPQESAVDDVSGSEMVWLYDTKMAAARAPGRLIYDQIKMAAPNGRCPLCGRGTVATLDHHLPKARYANLTITPHNLIPACQDCNKIKAHSVPHVAGEETLHPYFDDVDGQIWLRARIVEVAPAAAFYFADPPRLWSQTLRTRVRHHFRTFQLRKAYASVAAELISNIRGYLETNAALGGSQGIRDHVSAMASSHRAPRLNSWQAAAYQAMAESDWFCSGGYSQRD